MTTTLNTEHLAPVLEARRNWQALRNERRAFEERERAAFHALLEVERGLKEWERAWVEEEAPLD